MMVVLHIASIENDFCNNISVTISKMVMAQCAVEEELGVEIGFVNVNNVKIDGMDCQFDYIEKGGLDSLISPFNLPNIVVFHEIYNRDYLTIAKQCIERGIPYIIIPHGSLTKQAQQIKHINKIVGNSLFYNRFINNSKAIQLFTKKEAAETHTEKFKFIGVNGVRTPKVNKSRFGSDSINLIYIGELDIVLKGIDRLINAVSLIAKQARTAKLKLFLHGTDCRKSVKEITALVEKNKIQDIVKIYGTVKDKEELILESDVFVQMSRVEGMPTCLLEAMSYGIPCMITTGTGLGDLVNEYDAGWVVGETKSSEGIAKTLLQIIEEKQELSYKGQNAIKLIDKCFQESRIAKKTLKYYSNMINSNNTNNEDVSDNI